MKIICDCGAHGTGERHRPTCPTAAAFRHRCPACKTVKVKGYVRHATDCGLKEVQSP